MKKLLKEFLDEECNHNICDILIKDIASIQNKNNKKQCSEFFLNRFNIYLDENEIKIEDDIAFSEESSFIISLDDFLELLTQHKKTANRVPRNI